MDLDDEFEKYYTVHANEAISIIAWSVFATLALGVVLVAMIGAFHV